MFKVNSIVIFMINFYQKNISKFTPASCRYYPTCSEYTIWQFKNNNFFLAIIYSTLRILKCNQFFKGGINYPIISKNFETLYVFKKIKSINIIFWFVPFKDDKFYVIKKFKGI
ncbi:membrane protein insertion efficiency factor, YidD family [Campylobacter pinnipediorum subsp. pinnipediorum]|nr:membrane protein insertion efficiency factor, YidD family [Campylobacter pinnipediorum subsp. pinnipediorum]AQW84345.1 membrane protein insertion efficiency factor, YidD family [Campylobacter pinnipediorum subsp. pinnipediorum]